MVSSLFNRTLLPLPSPPVFVSQFLFHPPLSSSLFFLPFSRGDSHLLSSKTRSGNSLLYIDAKLARSILRSSIAIRVPVRFYFLVHWHTTIYSIDRTVDWSIEKNHRLCVYICINIYICLKNSWKKFVAGV